MRLYPNCPYHVWTTRLYSVIHCQFRIHKYFRKDHLHSHAKQPIWRTTSKLRPSTNRIIYGYSFVWRYFSSNREINASGLYMTYQVLRFIRHFRLKIFWLYRHSQLPTFYV